MSTRWLHHTIAGAACIIAALSTAWFPSNHSSWHHVTHIEDDIPYHTGNKSEKLSSLNIVMIVTGRGEWWYSDEGIGGDKIRDMEELLGEVRHGKIIHSFSHLFLHSLFLQHIFHNSHSSKETSNNRQQQQLDWRASDSKKKKKKKLEMRKNHRWINDTQDKIDIIYIMIDKDRLKSLSLIISSIDNENEILVHYIEWLQLLYVCYEINFKEKSSNQF